MTPEVQKVLAEFYGEGSELAKYSDALAAEVVRLRAELEQLRSRSAKP